MELAYAQVFDSPRLLTRQLARRIASTGSEGSTVNTASAIGSLAQASAVAADEVVDVEIALAEHKLPDNTRRSLDQSKIEQTDLLRLAETHATDAQLRDIEAVSNDDTRLNKFRAAAALAATNATDENAGANEAPVWLAASSQRLSTLDSLLDKIISQASYQAGVDAHSAWLRVGIFGGGALLLLLLITAFTVAVARSVSVPLRRLRSAAGETANVRLPAAVQQIEREGPDAVVSVPPALPPGQEGGPETAEVASAFDGLTSEAVRLASAQMRLRRSLDDAFVSMSRRSQSMVEKQLGIIDELERTEEDPDQLRNLFRLDHLAARMRRYNDNLLVLAGSVVRTRSNAPVPIADVFRAATSEMEQYERVRLQPVSGAAVAGPAAGGLIHLLAELLDNAAMYSPPTSPILMAAAFTAEGGLRLEITDSGVGIPANELAELNTRLASPGAFDMQVPSRMGLYVVARLAQRGGFAAQLAQRAGAAGTVAEVIVPPSLVIGASGTGFESRTPTSRPQVEPAVPGVRTPAMPVGSPGGRPAPSAPAPGFPAVPAASVRQVRRGSHHRAGLHDHSVPAETRLTVVETRLAVVARTP